MKLDINFVVNLLASGQYLSVERCWVVGASLLHAPQKENTESIKQELVPSS